MSAIAFWFLILVAPVLTIYILCNLFWDRLWTWLAARHLRAQQERADRERKAERAEVANLLGRWRDLYENVLDLKCSVRGLVLRLNKDRAIVLVRAAQTRTVGMVWSALLDLPCEYEALRYQVALAVVRAWASSEPVQARELASKLKDDTQVFIKAILAVFKVTRDPEDLAKARAVGQSLIATMERLPEAQRDGVYELISLIAGVWDAIAQASGDAEDQARYLEYAAMADAAVKQVLLAEAAKPAPPTST